MTSIEETCIRILGVAENVVKQFEIEHEKRLFADEFRGFNLFRILDRTSSEVKCHSAIIADLLNPQGSHCQGDRFLKLFMRHLVQTAKRMLKESESGEGGDLQYLLEVEGWQVSAEASCLPGSCFANSSEEILNGRIDILLSTPHSMLVIENKIYAGDQQAQLLRYWEWARRWKGNFEGNKFEIIYLTLGGARPSDKSLSHDLESRDVFRVNEENQRQDQTAWLLEQNRILLLSYDSCLDPWLEECMQVCTISRIRENLIQYRQVIAFLVENHRKRETVMSIADHLNSSESLHAAFEIEKALKEVKAEILSKLLTSLMKRMKTIGECRYGAIDIEKSIHHYFTRSKREKGFTISIILEVARFSGRTLELHVAVHDNLYCGLYLFDLSPPPVKAEPLDGNEPYAELIANAIQLQGLKCEPDGGNWWYPKRKLNFWRFDDECIVLRDPFQLEEYAEAFIADIQGVVAHLKKGSLPPDDRNAPLNGSQKTAIPAIDIAHRS